METFTNDISLNGIFDSVLVMFHRGALDKSKH